MKAAHLEADDSLACDAVRAGAGGAEELARLGIRCLTDSRPNYQQAAQRMHPGGTFVRLCDGSVRFIRDFIEISASPSYRAMWDRLSLSSDGEVIAGGQF